jgi:DNA-binding MarR family transcriptional regulator
MARTDPTAVRLAVAIKRLRARLQEQAPATDTGLSMSQLAIMHRLRTDGPATAASLAAVEHVTPQAIAQSLAALKRAGLVRTTAHPSDSRSRLVHVTSAGNKLFEAIRASRDAWLAQAIESVVRPHERVTLDRAIELLERLADAEVGASRGARGRRVRRRVT